MLKDRLYTHATHSESPVRLKRLFAAFLDALIRLMAPILPFTGEEAFQAMYEGLEPDGKAESVHTLLFPVYERCFPWDPRMLQEWETLLEVRDAV